MQPMDECTNSLLTFSRVFSPYVLLLARKFRRISLADRSNENVSRPVGPLWRPARLAIITTTVARVQCSPARPQAIQVNLQLEPRADDELLGRPPTWLFACQLDSLLNIDLLPIVLVVQGEQSVQCVCVCVCVSEQ